MKTSFSTFVEYNIKSNKLSSTKLIPTTNSSDSTIVSFTKTRNNTSKLLTFSPSLTTDRSKTVFKREKFNLFTHSPMKSSTKTLTIKEKLKKFKIKPKYPLNYKILEKSDEKVDRKSIIQDGEFSGFKIGDDIKLYKNQLMPSEYTLVKLKSNNFLKSKGDNIKLQTLLPEDELKEYLRTENELQNKLVNIKETHKRNKSKELTKNNYTTMSTLHFDASKKNFKDHKFSLPLIHNLF
jgi:hypothetical protein